MPTCLQQLLRLRLLSSILWSCYCHMGSDGARSVAGTDEVWTQLLFWKMWGEGGKNKARGVKSCQAAI